MKFFISVVPALAALASAVPLEKRQNNNLTAVGSTSSEFSQGGCRDVIWFFARGSTETGNMGTICGPPTGDNLKKAFGAEKVAVEGINYDAALSTNFLPGGADPVGIQAMKDGVMKAVADCPGSTIMVSGYSQGAAVTHRAVENMPDEVKSRIAGAMMYGDTQKMQDNNQIPNYPPEKTKIICNVGDEVCIGTLNVLPPHLMYGMRADEGAAFLTQMAMNDMVARGQPVSNQTRAMMAIMSSSAAAKRVIVPYDD